MQTGGCHCGGVRYQVTGEPVMVSLCHCQDCRRSAGAPIVAWAMFRATALEVTAGKTRVYASSENGRRHFCADCGSGLFYENAVILPGIIDVQSATLDDPESLPPRVQMQLAERLSWVPHIHEMPAFDRYPTPT